MAARPSLAPRSKVRRRLYRSVWVLVIATALGMGWRSRPRLEAAIGLELARHAVAGGRLEEAKGRLDLLIKADPRATWPRLLRAEVARKLGKITEAEEVLQRAIELGLPVEEARPEHDRIRAGEGL